MPVGLLVGVLSVVVTLVTPLLPRPLTPRWRRYRRAGWVLFPATGLVWAGFLLLLDPGSPVWLYFPCLGLVIAASAALIFAGFVCAKEQKSYSKGRESRSGGGLGGDF